MKFLASAGMNQGNSRSGEKADKLKRFRNCRKQKLVTDELHGVREKEKSRMMVSARYIYIYIYKLIFTCVDWKKKAIQS